MRVNMAFGQTRVIAFYSWGVAPGYGEKRPSAKRTQLRVPIWRITTLGETDLPLFAAVLRAGGWTNLGGEFGPPTRVGADDRGHERNLPNPPGHIDRMQFPAG